MIESGWIILEQEAFRAYIAEEMKHVFYVQWLFTGIRAV
jgi:hypothetical protein